MKYKTTKKEVKSNYRSIIRLGAVELYYLLKFTEPVAYTSGVYGWNADIYDLGNVAIVTGYRSFGNITPDYEIVEKYNQLGKVIYEEEHNPSKDWNEEDEDKKNRLNKLIEEFIKEVTNQKEEK
nr:MAG TPA: hypothetical protein [Caudoviricetes sp.]